MTFQFSKRRWRVETDLGGERPAVWYVEELAELQDLVEQGPDWNLIDGIHITLDRKSRSPEEVREMRKTCWKPSPGSVKSAGD